MTERKSGFADRVHMISETTFIILNQLMSQARLFKTD